MANPPIEQMAVAAVTQGLLLLERSSPFLALLAPANGMILNALQSRIAWQKVQDWVDEKERAVIKLALDYLVERFTNPGLTEAEYLKTKGMYLGEDGLPHAIREVGGDNQLIGLDSPSQQDGSYEYYDGKEPGP